MLWALDYERPDGLLVVEYPYFEREEPMVFDESRAHMSQTDAVVRRTTVTHEWNHGLGEIVTALLEAGMELTDAGRARQRPLGGAARADDAGRTRASGG